MQTNYLTPRSSWVTDREQIDLWRRIRLLHSCHGGFETPQTESALVHTQRNRRSSDQRKCNESLYSKRHRDCIQSSLITMRFDYKVKWSHFIFLLWPNQLQAHENNTNTTYQQNPDFFCAIADRARSLVGQRFSCMWRGLAVIRKKPGYSWQPNKQRKNKQQTNTPTKPHALLSAVLLIELWLPIENFLSVRQQQESQPRILWYRGIQVEGSYQEWNRSGSCRLYCPWHENTPKRRSYIWN